MTKFDARAELASPLPSVRGRAAEWLLSNATPDDSQMLTEAIERESVPSIKRLLVMASNRGRAVLSPSADHPNDTVSHALDTTAVLDDLAGLIRHETEPVIGWLRRSAARDIGDAYTESATFKNIELLRLRLRGLEALAAAHRVPQWSRVSLGSLIADCRPPDFPEGQASEDSADEIDTDQGLLSVILTNALLNASEASQGLGAGAVLVESAVTDRDFWITITNRFRGQGFELEHVAHTGASTKQSHKGLGLSAMRIAAQRLGYEMRLSATGGTASFALRGTRFRG